MLWFYILLIVQDLFEIISNSPKDAIYLAMLFGFLVNLIQNFGSKEILITKEDSLVVISLDEKEEINAIIPKLCSSYLFFKRSW